MGLSIGQREAASALLLPTASNLEGVMQGNGSVSKPGKVIDISDLVTDSDSDSDSDSEKEEALPGSGVSGLNTAPTGMGGGSSTNDKVDPTLAAFPSTSVQPTNGSGTAGSACGTYLHNPASGPGAWLFNQQLPSVLLKQEKVEHRIMLYLKGQGKSNREVAQYMGYSDAQISQITRQPWFVRDLRELLESEGKDLVRKMLEGTAVDSIVTLVNIRDSEKAPASVRVGAANSLLDRLLGKPKQEVTIEKKENPLTRVEAVNGELSELEAREVDLKKQLSRMASVLLVGLTSAAILLCQAGCSFSSATAYTKAYQRSYSGDSSLTETGVETGYSVVYLPKLPK